MRVWYAQGSLRPGMFLPEVPVRAVVVLRYAEGHDERGRPVLRHQAELVFHTDGSGAYGDYSGYSDPYAGQSQQSQSSQQQSQAPLVTRQS